MDHQNIRKLVALCAVLLSLSSPAWALEHFVRPIQDQNGKAVAGASVTVYVSGTTTLATLYSDNGITAKANPFTTPIDGLADFYTASGLIDLKISKTGFPAMFWDANKLKHLGVFDPVQHVIPSGISFPSAPETGAFFVITGDDGTCTGGSGALATLCRWSGSDWAVIGGAGGGGGASGLDANFAIDSSISAATSATPFRAGDGVSAATDICIGTDSTLGGFVKPCTDADTRTYIWTNKTHCLYDVENASCMETFDPDSASTLAMYQYAAGYRPLKAIWLGAAALSTDGTNCTDPAERTINSGPKLYTILCADNSSSIIYGSFQAPLNWDGGTLTFSQVLVQTAADTNPINADVSAQCKGGTEVVNSTWGTSQAMDASVTGSNANDIITSAAVTPSGSCAAGDMVYFRYVVDATGTTTAMGTLHTLGFTVRYREVSRSN